MKRLYIVYITLGMLLAAVSHSCSDDGIVENPSGETFIYTLNVTNGGLAGNVNYAGTVDQENQSVNFYIAAETDVEAIRFGGKLSLGASLTEEVYNFSRQPTQQMEVVNGGNQRIYQVNIALAAATEHPILQAVSLQKEDGDLATGYIHHASQTVYLNAPQSNSVEITAVSGLPKRSTYRFTNLRDGKIWRDDPGEVILDFLGLESAYHLSFEPTPTFGADFFSPLLLDYSASDTGFAMPGDFSAENTRSADFDGNKVLIVSREGGNYPKILSYDDLRNGNAGNAKILDITGVADGTYLISAGRLSHNHIYIANLTTGVADSGTGRLKIYHWADEYATAETVFSFDGTHNGTRITSGRFGDNLSVCLDEQGNGTIFLLTQDGTEMLRLDVTNFTQVDNPRMITPPVTASYYSSVNQVQGSDNEFILTSTQAIAVLIDREGNVLYRMDPESIPIEGTDIRIFNYNNERYMLMTTARAAGKPVQTVYLYDLSAGANTVQALTQFEEGDRIPLFSYELNGAPASAFSANTGWGVVHENLRIFGAAVRAGFIVVEFPKNTEIE
ncbi:MAG: DUF4623 domain-containing protein [Bacteroides sp.]|nr:DUF4623 domain-containing protein [Bacteroides sp.]